VRGIALAAVLAACAGTPPVETPRPASEREISALEGARLVAVDLSGLRTQASAPLRARLVSRPGARLHRETLAADLHRLWDTGVLSDVAALARPAGGGVALTFAVVERPLVRRAWLEGDPPPSGARRIAGLAGGLYEPARLHRMAARLRESFQRAGHRRAEVSLRVSGADRGRVDVCFHAAAGPRYLIDAIEFAGTRRMSAARLAAGIQTHGGAVNAPGAPYREDLLAEDLARIPMLYYDLGFIDVHIEAPRLVIDEARRRLHVVVPVREGPIYRLRKVSLPPRLARQRRRYLAALGVRPGEPFSRARLVAGMERVQALAKGITGADIALVPETAIDTDRHLIDLALAIDGEAAP